MVLKWLGGTLVVVPALVVLAVPALAAQQLPPPTVMRLAPPSGSIGFGGTVAGAGDVNADGLGDVLVNASGSNRVYVVSGTGAVIRSISGPSTPEFQFGAALASIGDVNRDGVPDFAVGAPVKPVAGPPCPSNPQCGAPGSRGRIFVFSGASGDMIRELMPPATVGAGFGRSVTGAGDLSGDGVADIVVGAPSHPTGPGTVLAFSGANGTLLWSRSAPSSAFGELVVSTSDVSGDGVDDALVSAPSPSSAGLAAADSGQVIDALIGVLNQVLTPVEPDRVHILSGATGEVVRSIADPAPNRNDAFGATTIPAGDQDGDGVGDHLIGEMGANQIHLYSGRNGVLIRSIAAPADAQGQGRFALARVDDKDGDGRDDFWVGVGSARAVYLINGQGTVLSSAAGPSPQGTFGVAVGTVGNVGGDPGADLVVGDPAEPGGGAAYLLYTGAGAAPAVRTAASPAAGCSGAACGGVLRLRAQTTVPTTTLPTTTVPTTTTSLTTTTTQATIDEAPATASLPKPATATPADGAHPGTGGVDRSVVGFAALGLGLAGISFLRRVGEPPPRRPPSTA